MAKGIFSIFYPGQFDVEAQQACEACGKVTAVAALGSAATGLFGLTPFEWGNLIITSIMAFGWFYFKFQDLRLRKDIQNHTIKKSE